MSRDHDPSPLLERICAPVLAINSADDAVNPPELVPMEKLIRRVPRGRFVLVPIGPETRGHGTHSYPAIWQEQLRKFLEELDSAGANSRHSPHSDPALELPSIC